MTCSSQSRPHVLVVEAARVLRDVVGAALAEAGYVLTLASSPNEALALLEKRTFDLIVSDLFARTKEAQLGSVARLRLCAQPTPVGLLTDWRLPEDAAQQQGFAWVIQKPFAVDEFLATIAASLHSPFSPEQAQQVELIKRYLALVAAGEWDVLRAICSPTLCYYPPRAGAFAPLRKIEGLEAYLEYAQHARSLYVDYRLDHCVVFLQQQRLVTHFTSSWQSATGERVSSAGTMLCRFAGERLAKIAFFMNRARLERLLASAAGTGHPFTASLSRNTRPSQAGKLPEPPPRAFAAPSAPVTPQLIGERVRSARIAANKTQQQLAEDTYSKSYISAVERGKMTPSVQALSVLAERLGLPMSYFLGESDADLSVLAESSATLRSTPERERLAREEGLALLFSEAEGLLRRQEPEQALARLGTPETLEDLSASQRPRWYLLEGWAWLLKQNPLEASSFLEKGLTLAEHLRMQAPLSQKGTLTELAERLRCFLGSAQYEQGQPELALEQHRRCLAAITDGLVTDPELTLRIYLALGQDYLLLTRSNDAMEFYEQAVKQASDAESLASEATIYWHQGLASKDTGDFSRAKTNLNKALVAFELQENMRLAAQLRSLFGQVLVNLERYEEAEDNLNQSLGAAQRTGDASTRGSALGNFASLHTARGDHDKAISVAREGLEVVKASKDQRTEGQLHLTLAMAHEAKADYPASEQELGQAITIFEQTGDKELIGRAHERYGKFLADRGRFQEAYEQMKTARTATTRKLQDL
jgi:transcriptional regulator with XRE-family HTH domain/DNA-binding NarL/FixJ family response regulator